MQVLPLIIFMRYPAFIILSIACLACSDRLKAEPRVWTNNDDKQLTAELVRVDHETVVLRLSTGRQASVPLASLSAADRGWLKANAATAGATVDEGGRPPAERRSIPKTVQDPMRDMNIRVVKEVPGDCLYESAHFEFKTTAKLGSLVMKDICGAFESTHELVRRLPWGVIPVPEPGRAKFRAELFETRAGYLGSGAPSWSGGVYVQKDKVFRMPFEELGLTKAPTNKTSGYARSGPINNDTITHEITHQMMHEYLQFAPVWFLEGTAEYTAHLPYRNGEFNVAGAVQAFKDMRDSGRKPQRRRLFRSVSANPSWIGVSELWGYTDDITRRKPVVKKEPEKAGEVKMPPAAEAPNLDPQALSDRYYSSHALVFYFMHLDGAGNAARLKKYFDAIHEEKGKWAGFWPSVEAYRKRLQELEPLYDAYQKAMVQFRKQPGVEDLGNGRISYPANLTPPAAPPSGPEAPKPPDGTDPDDVSVKHLGVLLDGRSLEQLEREVVAGFAKAGISL